MGITLNDLWRVMTPSIGRIVHYQRYGSPGGEHKAEPSPAVITQVFENGEVQLFVMNPNGLYFNRTPYSEEPKPGHWNWPPKIQLPALHAALGISAELLMVLLGVGTIRSMDPNYVLAVSAVVICVMFSMNMIFMKKFMDKVENSWVKINVAEAEIRELKKQSVDISSMKVDVGILKSEIVRYLRVQEA